MRPDDEPGGSTNADEQVADLELPELPDGEVTYHHQPTGAADIWVVLITIALVPFVQAIVSAWGTKLAGVIDDATRRAARRLLRGLYDRPLDNQPAPDNLLRARVVLTEPVSGAEVELDPDLPPVALAQLVQMTFDPSVVGHRVIYWWPNEPTGRWHVSSSRAVAGELPLTNYYGKKPWIWDDKSGRWRLDDSEGR